MNINKKNILKLGLSFPGTVAAVQEPQREVGLLGRERSTVTPVLQGNELQDAGGGTCRASIQTRCEYTNDFEVSPEVIISAHAFISPLMAVMDAFKHSVRFLVWMSSVNLANFIFKTRETYTHKLLYSPLYYLQNLIYSLLINVNDWLHVVSHISLCVY